MKWLFPLAACVLILVLYASAANSGSADSVAASTATSDVQKPEEAVQIKFITPYMSWREKVMIQRAIKKRAAASRTTLMKKAAIDEQRLLSDTGRLNP
jgi:hypothetical protein